MNNAKPAIMEHLNMISDDVKDDVEIHNRLYMLIRLEHSRKRCKSEGTISDDEVAEYFSQRKKTYI